MNFDSWLEKGLQEASGRYGMTSAPAPKYSSKSFGWRSRSLGAIFALAGSQAAMVAVTTVTLTAAAVGVKTAATGDPNPLNWGAQVTQQVATCKAAASASAAATPSASATPGPGQHGIGQCVSSFAKQHGPSERAQHSQSGKTPHATPSAGSSDHSQGPPSSLPANANGHPTGKP